MKTFLINNKYEIKANEIEEAEKWLIENYPNEYFSSNIRQIDGNDFSIIAVEEYYQEIYNTKDRNIILNKIKEFLDKQTKINNE